MPKFLPLFWIGMMLISSCQKKEQSSNESHSENIIRYAEGLSIIPHEDYTRVTVSNPWPGAQERQTYIFHKKGVSLADSLKNYTVITVPIQKMVATSTTHIPPLEMLEREASLIGFPNTNYISSEKTRSRIDRGEVRDVGTNLSLNVEVLVDMQPDVIMGFGVDGEKKVYEELRKSGLNIIFNGDWTEQHPLGKAEWILLFGVLFGEEQRALEWFTNIETAYHEAKQLVADVDTKPTVMSGSVYQDQWYVPQGKSWAAQFIEEAGGDYLWKDTKGEGSLALSFETVLEKAQHADFWIGSGQFYAYDQLLKANANYTFFKSFQEKKIFTFSHKKGPTGGVIYYELAASRPDWVLKDLIKIMYPELLPEHSLVFFEPLQ